MKKDQLKNLVGHRMRIRPIARRPNAAAELPQIDDDWTVETVEENRIALKNIRTHHVATLGLDHVHSYLSDPARDYNGMKYGFLQLRVQISIPPSIELIIEPLTPGKWDSL